MTPDRARAGYLAALAGDEPRLDVATAWIAAEENPDLEPDSVISDLDALAARIAVAEGPEAERVARIAIGLFSQEGFAGDAAHYDEPANSLIDQVLKRRRGMPILLAVVLLEVASRNRVHLHGIGFPGHFLVATHTDPPVVLDPFNGGRVLTRPVLVARIAQIDGCAPSPTRVAEATTPVGTRYILARINNNLKGSWLRRGRVVEALRAVERMLIVAPDLVEELRDRGLMRLHLGDPGGIADLRGYLQACPGASDRERIAARIRQG